MIYAAPVEKLLNHHVVGKSMDDRVGLVAMLRVLAHFAKTPKAKRPTITFVSTVMEEIGAMKALPEFIDS